MERVWALVEVSDPAGVSNARESGTASVFRMRENRRAVAERGLAGELESAAAGGRGLLGLAPDGLLEERKSQRATDAAKRRTRTAEGNGFMQGTMSGRGDRRDWDPQSRSVVGWAAGADDSTHDGLGGALAEQSEWNQTEACNEDGFHG